MVVKPCASPALGSPRHYRFHRSKSTKGMTTFEGVGVATVGPLSPEKQALVNQSWEQMKQDAPAVALKFFLQIFEIAPGAIALFSFLKDSKVPLEQNPRLKVHALLVLKTFGEAATQLGKEGALDELTPVLQKLGRAHVPRGVIDPHFDVVKAALLQTIAGDLPGPDSAELTEAWGQAFDTLADIMKAAMQAERAGQA